MTADNDNETGGDINNEQHQQHHHQKQQLKKSIIKNDDDKIQRKKMKLKSSTTNNNNNENKNHVNIPSTSTTTTMNLRNRTLKKSSIIKNNDDKTEQNGNSKMTLPNTTPTPATTTTIINNKKLTTTTNDILITRRRSNRRQNNNNKLIDSSSTELNQQSLPTTTTSTSNSSTRSIRSFFPLRTIGNVCELFRSQLDPGNDYDDDVVDNCNNDDDDEQKFKRKQQRNEPDLTLLSIVLGIIETSLTRGLYSTEQNLDSTSTNNTQTTLSESITIDNNDTKQQQQQQQQHNDGSYSPAEASIAPIVNTITNDTETNTNNNTIVVHTNIIHTPLDIPIPTVYYEMVENLQKKFQQHIKESIDLDKYNQQNNDDDLREIIKKISELIWSNLHRSHYKDRAHLQTIYSYINENKLDCYGVAYTVLAACQILNLNDVYLVMSEDHAWVTYGKVDETLEITWHGKCGNDDRCGQSIPINNKELINCWLYLNGNTMKCNRFEMIATLVSAMNLSINSTQDSEELAILQQHLLWILYDYGYLRRYPMALGTLGDIEDVCSIHSTTARKHPLELFNEAIESAKKYYNDYHVYPYTYLGGYYFRKRKFKQAIQAWSDASRIIQKYNYTKDDEEIYKEFQEISNDLIPYIIKYSSSTSSNNLDDQSIINDPECFVYLLKFYDGLCAWEEDSTTPVLHIGWTKPIVSTISKFPYRTRSQIMIKVDPTLNIKYQSSIDNGQCNGLNNCDNNVDDLNVENNNNNNNDNNNSRERRRRRAASISQHQHQPVIIKQENNGDSIKTDDDGHNNNLDNNDDDVDHNNGNKIIAILISKKFSGIKNLLTADKLNTSAIQLQLTAQSQVNIFNHNKRNHNQNFINGKTVSTGKCSGLNETESLLNNSGTKSSINVDNEKQQQQQQRTTSSSTNSTNKRLRRE